MSYYRDFTLRGLNTSKYAHLKLLLFWPIYGLTFWFAERGLNVTYHAVHCALDDRIPFCEYFIVLYLFWFVFIFGFIAYSLLTDIPAFKRYMWFVIVTYIITMTVYLVYPTKQDLRPAVMEHSNAFTWVVSLIYSFDTNTNVCPSLHVIGGMAVVYGAWNSRRFGTPGWRAAFLTTAILISLSTLFVKQHSAVDLLCAFGVCLIAWPFAARMERRDTAACLQLEAEAE